MEQAILAEKKLQHSLEKPHEQLLNKAKEGDTMAFGELVEMYQKNVFRSAYGYFMNKEDALEVVQETFYRAFKNLSKLKETSKFESWLLRIAVNISHDIYRKRRRIVSDEVITNDHATEHNETDKSAFLKEKLMKRNKELKDALDILPHKQKTVIVMRYFQEMKFKDIAESLGVSIGTVKNLHFRGIEKLKIKKKTVLEEHYEN